ncbi:hypothetical protein QYF36_018526 [Acer negundo]|nr:hypothetical protein QYF36_018526 [Acer negundo]
MEKRCKFWVPRKNRHCANTPVNESLFCGMWQSHPESKRNRHPFLGIWKNSLRGVEERTPLELMMAYRQ